MFRNREVFLQFCKFGVVGIISLLVDYGLMIGFVEVFAMDYFAACAFSYTSSVFVNYVLSMRYVFHGREDLSKTKEATIYFVLGLLGLLFNQAIMWFAVDLLGIYYTLAKLLSTLMVTGYNFISRKKFLE